jgi:hypothetical protein
MARGALKTYNLAMVKILLGGVPMDGFGESDALSFEANSDLFESAVGADGEVTRSATNDRSGVITLTLMSTSKANDWLNTWLSKSKTVELTLGAGDKFEIYVKDLNSLDTLIAADAYIQKEPTSTYGRNAAEREWTIYAANVSTIFGGSLT